MIRKEIVLYIALACSLGMQAQTRQQLGGVYYAYPNGPEVKTGTFGKATAWLADSLNQLPAGFTPFYISHYGRHGSRWMPHDNRYTWIYQHFEDESNLTPLGLKVKALLKRVVDNAMGNGGKLSKLGALQHQGIALRMYQHYPQIFAAGNHVKARSSVVDRCAKSMQAFTSELRLLQPSLNMDVKTDSADMAWIAYVSPEIKALEKRTNVVAQVSPDRFLRQLFKDIRKVDEPLKLMGEMQAVTSSIQDVGLNFPSYPQDIEDGLNALFTDDEFRAFYEANNRRMTINNGSEATNEEIPARCAISLWQNIEAEADAALASEKSSATLRFGHDTALYRLLSLLFDVTLPPAGAREEESSVVLGDEVDKMDRVVPMAANLQMIFYKNPQDSVLVKFMLNERDIKISPVGQVIYGTRYYSWNSWKQEMHERIHNLEHIRQLNAINTMVGTAQANTQTAGMFGKGSEEHGQTLPAVLVPNGQNFWTPQTQDTEQKCIAPYYYKDTQLQGFRCSHWLVGGCTQDYGSFTVAALGGKLRLQPEQRATPFSHADEVSHPHYYAVNLKDEHLKAEMTALSHTSILRVTPDKDELVHLVINPNSDEGQGYIEIDTINHVVYGYNPVHRIYQGWGKPAGFSGHFVLAYDPKDLVDYGVFEGENKILRGLKMQGKPRIGAWLTFRAKAGEPKEWMSGTSFTSRENALANLNGENYMYGGLDFNSMMEYASGLWVDRLHTIDVESRDTAKVNQFYGALYRASFLPHEMSDVDGDYPEFSTGVLKMGGATLSSKGYAVPAYANFKKYGDFSMWDIYRAELPLYSLITPKMSGEMMQSLVQMYKEGGWMPIFPCWNSYTAAMIGDHASAALADAYVKGIRNFDAEKAYEGMRMNAFSTPYVYKDYQDGKGRRAIKSYIDNGYIPLEDMVEEAFHTNEQTSRTLEYAYDDYAVAQMAKALLASCKDEAQTKKYQEDYDELMRRSENWRNVINPITGWADGRHEDGKWEGNEDLVHRKSYITEGATCHYTWYVPQNPEGLFEVIRNSKPMDKSEKLIDKEEKRRLKEGEKIERNEKVISRLDKMFDNGWYWHGNEPCHQVAYLYDVAGAPEKTQERVHHILQTEYNDTPGGLSGNDDAGQMSAWYVFSAIGFYPVCPGTPYYYIGTPSFDKVTLNLENGKKFVLTADGVSKDAFYIQKMSLNNKPLDGYKLSHTDILNGGKLNFQMKK